MTTTAPRQSPARPRRDAPARNGPNSTRGSSEPSAFSPSSLPSSLATPPAFSAALLFQSACLVLGSYRQAERWFSADHPLLDTTPLAAQASPSLAPRLGALIEALSKGWPA